MRLKFRLVAGLAAVSLLAAGCTGGDPDDDATGGETAGAASASGGAETAAATDSGAPTGSADGGGATASGGASEGASGGASEAATDAATATPSEAASPTPVDTGPGLSLADFLAGGVGECASIGHFERYGDGWNAAIREGTVFVKGEPNTGTVLVDNDPLNSGGESQYGISEKDEWYITAALEGVGEVQFVEWGRGRESADPAAPYLQTIFTLEGGDEEFVYDCTLEK